MNAMEVEQAARLAWPALEEQELPYGVLRFAQGADRRSNSLSFYSVAIVEPAALIAVTEKFYQLRNAVPIVRIIQHDNACLGALAEIDFALQCRGYQKQSPTLSMTRELKQTASLDSVNAAVFSYAVSRSEWLRVWYQLTGKPMESIDAHRAILEKLTSRHLFLVRRDAQGTALSCGMAVCEGNAIGLFGIATSSKHRKQGYASAILSSLCSWGRGNGARYVFLQVEEENSSALSLYSNMGFKKLYSYWYRVGSFIGDKLQGIEK